MIGPRVRGVVLVCTGSSVGGSCRVGEQLDGGEDCVSLVGWNGVQQRAESLATRVGDPSCHVPARIGGGESDGAPVVTGCALHPATAHQSVHQSAHGAAVEPKTVDEVPLADGAGGDLGQSVRVGWCQRLAARRLFGRQQPERADESDQLVLQPRDVGVLKLHSMHNTTVVLLIK